MTMKMYEVYPNGGTGNGIFSDLQSLDVPWKNEEINQNLDIVYYSKSGEKSCAQLINGRVNSSGILDSVTRNEIASAVYTVFNHQWNKLYNTLSLTYNPIENYRMTEVEDITNTTESTQSNTGTVRNTGDNTRTETGTVSNSGTDSRDDSIYGFNSSTGVNSNSSSGSNSGTETHNMTFGDAIDETETRNLSNSVESEGSNNRELTRSGNIGVTTSQQMISSERELWKWNFFNVVFSDIDSLLCLDVYDYSEKVI